MPVKRARVEVDEKKTPTPMCKKHMAPLVYRPELLEWRCVADGCASYKRTQQSEENGRMSVYRGPVELMTVDDGAAGHAVYLRLPDSNLLVDVTKYMVDVEMRADEEDKSSIVMAECHATLKFEMFVTVGKQ